MNFGSQVPKRGGGSLPPNPSDKKVKNRDQPGIFENFLKKSKKIILVPHAQKFFQQKHGGGEPRQIFHFLGIHPSIRPPSLPLFGHLCFGCENFLLKTTPIVVILCWESIARISECENAFLILIQGR
jgi:hypothetical protein